MASSARPALSPENIMDGTIEGRGSPSGLVRINCHDSPYLSWIQPYLSLKGYLSIGMSTVPPSVNFCHAMSSFFLASFSGEGELLNNKGSKFTMKDTDG